MRPEGVLEPFGSFSFVGENTIGYAQMYALDLIDGF